MKFQQVKKKNTEIDFLLLHESGIYVFEVKYYKGAIYGKVEDEIWTQFFRTQKNSHFHSPVKQNDYHIENLRRIFPNEDIYSVVCLARDDCKNKVTGSRDDLAILEVCDLPEFFESISQKTKKYSAERIDEMFNALQPYSKLQRFSCECEPDFDSNRFISEVTSIVARKKKRCILYSAVCVAAAVFFAVIACKVNNSNVRNKAQEEKMLVNMQLAESEEKASEAFVLVSELKQQISELEEELSIARNEDLNADYEISQCILSGFSLMQSLVDPDNLEVTLTLEPVYDVMKSQNRIVSIEKTQLIIITDDGQNHIQDICYVPENKNVISAQKGNFTFEGIKSENISQIMLSGLSITDGVKPITDQEYTIELYHDL